MKRTLAFGMLWGLLALLASSPLWVTLPEPDAIAIDKAVQLESSGARQITLPRAQKASGPQHFHLEFQLDDVSPLYLFIPVLRQRAVIELAGQQIDDTGNRADMVGLASGVSALIPLPLKLLQKGRNAIDLHLQSAGLVPGYLSEMYVGSANQLAPYYRIRVFLLEYLLVLAPASQLLIALIVLIVWLYRPQEALFGWLLLLLLTSMFVYLGMLRDMPPHSVELMPYINTLGTAASAILVITVLLIAGLPPPRWLKLAVVVAPIACMLLGASGLVSEQRLILFVNVPLNILGLLISLAIAGWAALARRVNEAWLLIPPLLFASLAALHDLAVVTSTLNSPVFLSAYCRPTLMIGIAMILMRRLGLSLTQLDNANAYLKQRLQEQKQELERLHRGKRQEAAQWALSSERTRLTADLHDGLSGHLASIIALAEREKSDQVERAAREALDDLRLVIHSLDIRDRDLPLALAGLRERLERQLRRMGVELEWSMARLPEIAGVTPSNALNVLRILQEAITNALRHGQAAWIAVLGDQDGEGRARIVVRNDGIPFSCVSGHHGNGLKNMHHRVRLLNGRIDIQPLENGSRLTLLLPLRLPEPAHDADGIYGNQ